MSAAHSAPLRNTTPQLRTAQHDHEDPPQTPEQADFLQIQPERIVGLCDGVLMNPPFKMGTDIKHIRHALDFLSPGGVLVSLCAAGPKQRKAFATAANEWIDLPAGSFKESYTNVAAAIVVFRK